jgi:enamine deaminase RidA (YjgF/YER057c/UK114 family)
MFLSGHGPVVDGRAAIRGKLTRDLSLDEGRRAAELTVLSLLSTLKSELGTLDRVRRVLKLLVLVNSEPEFTRQPAVADAASDLLMLAFGADRGRHARSAIGVVALPFDIPVEIEAVVQIENLGTS